MQERFYIGMGGAIAFFWRVGVADSVVKACVLRATTKKRSSTLSCPPNIFF